MSSGLEISKKSLGKETNNVVISGFVFPNKPDLRKKPRIKTDRIQGVKHHCGYDKNDRFWMGNFFI